MTNAAEYKKKLVQEMIKLARQYSIIGLVNMENMPAPQLQSMRSELREKISLFMTKKRFMKIALDKLKNEKNRIEELENYFEGMPALIFTSEDPFKLSRILQKSRTSAPAKAGQIAPNDIVINKGPTPFAPGPIISELSGVGLKVGVESGKVAVKEDAVIAKKGEKINSKVAEILTRLDIKPMEVGLGLVAAYEDGIVYKKDVLLIDEEAFNEKLKNAAAYAFNLAFNIAYVTKDNAGLLIAKAFNDAKALGLSQEILEKGIVEDLLDKAERSMSSLKNAANVEVVEKPKEEAKPEIKPEEKKIEAPVQEKVEKKLSSESEKSSISEKSKTFQKEEKVLEEEKKIIEEEKKLGEDAQKSKISGTHSMGKLKEAPVEKEVQQEVKKEEEKQLERERIGKEKELEKVETQKEEIKKEAEIKREPIERKEKKTLEEEKEILKEEQKLEEKSEQDKAPEEKEVQEALKEEEEKQLERERIKKEKEIEQEEKEKAKPEEDVDKKVNVMVEQTKKFAEGKEETAADIIEDVKKEEVQEKKEEKKLSNESEKGLEKSKTFQKEIPEKNEEPKQEKTIPSAHDLQKKKEEKQEETKSQDKQQKEVEDLTKELLKKGTLRKK